MSENNKYILFIDGVAKYDNIDKYYEYFINNYNITFIEFVQILNKYYNNEKKIKKYLIKYFKNDYYNIIKIINDYYKVIFETNDYLLIKNKFSYCSEQNMKKLVLGYFLTIQSEDIVIHVPDYENMVLSSYKNIKMQKPKNTQTKHSTRNMLFSKSIKNKVNYDINNNNIIDNYEKNKKDIVTNQFQILLTKYYNEFNLSSKNALICVNNITDNYFDDCQYILKLSKSIFIKADVDISEDIISEKYNNINNIIYLAIYDYVNPAYLQQTADNLTKNIIDSLCYCNYIDANTGEMFGFDNSFYKEFPLFLKKILCQKI